MRFNTLPTVAVVKKEEKEAKLKAFIADHIARIRCDGQTSMTERTMLLIARSHESPVVRALASAVADGGASGISLKALILVPGAASDSTWPAELAGSTEYRLLSDLRLLDAHEQLWLDDATAWVGDCMRREPSKRDAYECYAHGCTTTAQSVEAAFQRMWDKGQPTLIESDDNAITTAEPLDPHMAHVAPADSPAPTAATRH